MNEAVISPNIPRAFISIKVTKIMTMPAAAPVTILRVFLPNSIVFSLMVTGYSINRRNNRILFDIRVGSCIALTEL